MENNNYHLNKSFFRQPLKYNGLHVLQIGRMFCTGTTVIDTHVHLDCFELTVVTSGAGLIYANGTPTAVKKGDIYLSLPSDAHKIESDPENPLKFDFFAFRVSGECFEECFQKIARDYSSPHSRVLREERIRPLIGNAIAELSEESIYKTELLTALFRQILIYTIRGFEKIQPHRHTGVSRSEMLCYKLMHYMDTHIYDIKNLSELAVVTGYSYGYLSGLFRCITGSTLTDYFQSKKMDTAQLLLQENKLTVTEIAEMLNYASVYAFSKAFRNYFGISPREFAHRKTS